MHCVCVPKGSQAVGEDDHGTFFIRFKWSIQIGWDLEGP